MAQGETPTNPPRKYPFEPLPVALVGSGIGLLLVLLGFYLPFSPLGVDPESKNLRLAGSLENWRTHSWFVVLVAGTLFGGLALMFASLQLLRDQERTNQTMRRAVYGFNALLGTVLLLSVLGLVNLLAFTDPIDRLTGRVLTREFDWTKSGVYTVSPRTVSFLEQLQEPVRVSYIPDPREGPTPEIISLLRNCESISKDFKWETISLTKENLPRLQELIKKYAIKEPAGGMLVLVGKEQEGFEFLPADKLGKVVPDPVSRRGKFIFTGENALLGALTSLTQGQVTIYFTQGHGEPVLDAAPPVGGARTPSLASLKQRLTANRTRFEIKPLKLDASLTKIPDDASTVVIVGPSQPFGEHEVKLLRDYLNRKPEIGTDKSVKVSSGRLLALLGPVISRGAGGARIEATGLESLLGEYGVRLGEERVQTVTGNDPLRIDVAVNPRSENPLNRAFNDLGSLPPGITWFPLQGVRVLNIAADRQADPSIQQEPLLLASPGNTWAEKDLAREPSATAKAIQTDASMRKLLSREPLPVGVAVSRRIDAAPARQPGMPPEEGQERPLMLVVGSSSWVTDESLRGPSGDLRFDLFSSLLSWLREQSDLGKLVEDKATPEFELKANPETGYFWRLYVLPGVLMMFAVVGLGVGVWVVRRR
jgi:fumarate reductase subunit D